MLQKSYKFLANYYLRDLAFNINIRICIWICLFGFDFNIGMSMRIIEQHMVLKRSYDRTQNLHCAYCCCILMHQHWDIASHQNCSVQKIYHSTSKSLRAGDQQRFRTNFPICLITLRIALENSIVCTLIKKLVFYFWDRTSMGHFTLH